ncbi:hypothetical protein VTO42DRAFT_6928 [Malbranchea cinnamomea]
MSTPFEIGVSIVTLIQVAAKILQVTTQFTAEVSSASDRNSDLVSQVSLLQDVLPSVQRTLERRQAHIASRPVTPDEQDLLDAMYNVLNRIQTTVDLFAQKVSSLGGATGRWREVLLQLKLMKHASDIASLESRLNSEMSSLQLMMTCYSWYDKLMENEALPGYSANDEMTYQILTNINGNMQSFRQELNRLTDQLGVDPADCLVNQGPRGDKEYPKDEWNDLKMMLNCFDAATTMIKNLSRSGSVVTKLDGKGQAGSLWDSNPECYDPELQTELIRSCKERAERDLKLHNFSSAEFYLRRAIEEARKREIFHKMPFDERYEFETMLVKAYLGLSKFNLAASTLQALKPVAERNSANHAELWYLITDVCRRQYEATHDPRHFEEWDTSAVKAYNLARQLSSSPEYLIIGSRLLFETAKLMIEAHKRKNDDIIVNLLQDRHPGVVNLFRDTVPPEEDTRRSSARSCPPLPSTTPSRSTTRSGSVVSAPPMQNSVSVPQQSISLFEAIRQEDMAAVKDLLARNPGITEETDEDGQTPLVCAVKKRDILLVRILVHRSPVHIRDKSNKTVLHHAVFSYNHKDMVKAIIDHKDITPELINATDSKGQTALHQCVIYQKLDAARHLIAHGASLDVEDICGDTPPQLAESEKRLDFVKLFQQARVLIESTAFATMPFDMRYRYLCSTQPPRWHIPSSTAIDERRSSSDSDHVRRISSTSTSRTTAPSTRSVRKLFGRSRS